MLFSLYNNGYNVTDPNICPHCHLTIVPECKMYYFSKDTDSTPNVISIWQCPSESCELGFVVVYRKEHSYYELSRVLDGYPKGPDWPKPIKDLKDGKTLTDPEPAQSKFIKTYLQALTAENSGLDEIAGMGYRKSIEYLVKDWAIQTTPTDIDKIDKMSLAQNIGTYFTGDLKDILSRATWLGNDHAHYSKLFEEFDLVHIKELIDLIMVELDRMYKLNHYKTTIQPRK